MDIGMIVVFWKAILKKRFKLINGTNSRERPAFLVLNFLWESGWYKWSEILILLGNKQLIPRVSFKKCMYEAGD